VSRRGLAEGLCWLTVTAVLFTFLGTRGLNEPDEGRYAEASREMAVTGDWLIPRLNGIQHFQKPPALYWAVVGGMRLLGTNEWGARLPCALAALATTWLTFVIARSLFDRAVAWVAVCILVSSADFFWMARTLTPDMLLTFWTTAAIACLVTSARRAGRLREWGFFAAMGLGFLTKGPMALVVPISAALCWQGAARRRGEGVRLRWGRGLALTLCLGLSWFVTVSVRYPALARYFVVYEFVERVATHAHGRVQPVWFFVPVLLGGLFPWSTFIPAAVASLRRRAAQGFDPTHWLLIGWVLPPLVLLSLSGSKLVTYVLPLFPALAIALAAWWQANAITPVARITVIATAGALGIVAAAALLAPLASVAFDVSLGFRLLCLGVCTATAGALWALERRGRRSASPFVLSAAAVLLLLGSSYEAIRMNDALGMQASVRPLVQVLQEQPDAGRADMFKCGVHADGYEFYSARLVATTLDDADLALPPEGTTRPLLIASRDECERTFHDVHPVYGLVHAKRFSRSFPPRQWRVIARAGDFVLITHARDSTSGPIGRSAVGTPSPPGGS
jgi:4-amino-4-deoxy-L-arabinose transferase-like glycosyltransferase